MKCAVHQEFAENAGEILWALKNGLRIGSTEFSIWSTLHDGDLTAIESDRMARTLSLRFDVGYIRDFHNLPEDARFVIVISGVSPSARSAVFRGQAAVQFQMERLTNNSKQSLLNIRANGVKSLCRGLISSDWLTMAWSCLPPCSFRGLKASRCVLVCSLAEIPTWMPSFAEKKSPSQLENDNSSLRNLLGWARRTGKRSRISDR